MKSILTKKILNKNVLFRFAIFCLALYVSAVIFNLFYEPLNLVVGGANGIAILIHETFGISTDIVVTIVYVFTLILSFIFLDLEKSVSLILCTLIYPFFVSVTGNITSVIYIDYSDQLLISVIAGFLNGIMNGLIYKIGFNPGGLSVIAQIIYKYFHISISKVNLYMSMIIILLGGYYFGVDKILYAIIVMYITTIMTDKVLLGISGNKYIYIVTSKEDEIESFITKDLKHGITKIECETGFSLKKKYVLVCSIPTKEYTIFKEGVTLIDRRAFMVVTDVYQSIGGM